MPDAGEKLAVEEEAVNFSDIFSIGAAIIVSLGSAGTIIVGLSNHLAKLWAEKLMGRERHKHDQELAELRARLEKINQEFLTTLQAESEIYRETYLKQHNDKLDTYRIVIAVVAEFLADLDLLRLGHTPNGNVIDKFNRGRLKAYGHLAMLAPQKVMDAYDALVDCVFSVWECPNRYKGEQYYEQWKIIRTLALNFLNAAREDVGIDKARVEYRGRR